MKLTTLLTTLCFLLPIFPLVADEVTNIDEVEVRAKRIDKSSKTNAYTGSNATMADTALLATLQAAPLSEYLNQHSAIFVKESGKGMLSTVSMRGTAASQTAVCWNGIAINSLTMGQTDFSQIPIFFFDHAEIAPGGESSLYGNGAIGGSIDLRNSALDSCRFGGTAMQSVGSYGHRFSGLKLRGANAKFWEKTALFFDRAKNDFHFNIKDYSGTQQQLQHNAAYHSYGLLQELGWHINKRQQLALYVWHTAYDRDIQPAIQNNKNPDKYEDISDRNTRILLHYLNRNWLTFSSKSAYINDHQTYKGDIIATHNLLTNCEGEHEWTNSSQTASLQLKIGGQAQYIVPEVYAYNSNIDEWRNDLFAVASAQFGKHILLNAGIRQQWVSREEAPLSPSGGAKVYLVNIPQLQLSAKGNISRNYRVPTLNDRYWGNLDNKYLKAEDATNYDGGAECSFRHNNLTICLTGNRFHNDVDNWILWMPRGNVWKPINVDKVEVNGTELTLRADWKRHSLQAAYTNSHTEVIEGFSEMRPFKGRQIALLPESAFSTSYTGKWKSWKLVFSGNYTGERSTSDVFDVMQSYWLWNTALGHSFNLCDHTKLHLQFGINNIFDTDYQTVPYKAMPGRNFMGEVKLTF